MARKVELLSVFSGPRASEKLRPRPGIALKVLEVPWSKIFSSIVSMLRPRGRDSYEAWAQSRCVIHPVSPTPAPKANGSGRNPGVVLSMGTWRLAPVCPMLSSSTCCSTQGLPTWLSRDTAAERRNLVRPRCSSRAHTSCKCLVAARPTASAIPCVPEDPVRELTSDRAGPCQALWGPSFYQGCLPRAGRVASWQSVPCTESHARP